MKMDDEEKYEEESKIKQTTFLGIRWDPLSHLRREEKSGSPSRTHWHIVNANSKSKHPKE